MTEEIATQPEEIIEEQPENWFLEKLKIHKFKILVGILGILVFAGVIFGGYKLGQRQVQPGTVSPTPTPPVVATPTPDPTANWKTYTNTTLGFSLEYPVSLEAIDNTLKLKKYYQETDEKCEKEDGCGGGPRPSWVIDFLSASDKQEIATESPLFPRRPYQFSLSVYQGISLNILYGEKAPADEEQTLTDYSIGDKMGLRNIQRGDLTYGQNLYLFYGVDNKGKTYSFYFPNKTVSAQDLEYTESILSTFKFLEEETEGEKVFCKDPRPELCTMEAITNPPYICGSNGKSYNNVCGACADPEVEWYVIQDSPCGS